MIRFESVSKAYPGGYAGVRELSFSVSEGEFLALLGSSGSGKTTTLKLVNRLLEPSYGRILLRGEELAGLDPIELRRSTGYVLQRFGLLPHLTLRENIGIVPGLNGWQPERIEQRSTELLELFGLPAREYQHRYPHELSGGQQQRVGFARALAARPALMLLDEAFGALDAVTKARLQVEYRRIHDELGLTTLLVTHDVTEAVLLADRILVLHAGELVQLGTAAELLHAPASHIVSDLMQTPLQQLERLQRLAPARTSGPSA